MKFLKSGAFVAAVLAFRTLPAFAQEKQNPAPVAPAVQVDNAASNSAPSARPRADDLKRSPGLRILFFSNPKTPRISVAVEATGQKPEILASALPPWRGTDYYLFPPGKTKITLLPGSVLPAGPDQAPNLSGKLAEPLSLDLAPGTMTSVFVTETSGKLTTFLLSDAAKSSADAPSGPVVKTFNAGISGVFSIYAKSGSLAPTVIWDSSKPKISETPLRNGAGQYSFLLVEKTSQTEQPRVVYESVLSPSDVITLIVHEDRYGRITMTGISDRVSETSFSGPP